MVTIIFRSPTTASPSVTGKIKSVYTTCDNTLNCITDTDAIKQEKSLDAVNAVDDLLARHQQSSSKSYTSGVNVPGGTASHISLTLVKKMLVAHLLSTSD